MARREAKTPDKKDKAKAPTTPPPPPRRASKGSRKAARAAKMDVRRERKFKEHAIEIKEPYERGGTWRVLAHSSLIGEPRSRRQALRRAHQHIRNRGR